MVDLQAMERTTVEQEILARDLEILEAMAGGMADYLKSDVLGWDMRRPGMPLLTIGGTLMRLRRLNAMRANLSADQRLALARAQTYFDGALRETVVRFEQRAYQELNTRLREWTTYMRDLAHSTRISSNRQQYAARVDTRIVIGELVDKLSEYPYRLDGRVPRDVAALDRRLRLMWQPGGFVLAPVWEKAYPIDPYWWLYGSPKGA